MKINKHFTSLFLIIFLSATAIGTPPKTTTKTVTKTTKTSTTSDANKNEKKAQWISWEEMVKLNEKNPKKIFVDFYTEWCGWCKVMDKNTFEDPIVSEIMSKYFYCVKFDAERRDTIHFLNRNWVFVPGGRSGYHQLAAYFMENQLSYPTMTILTHDYKLITPLKGYIAVPQFEPLISFYGQDFWMPEKEKSFDDFKQQYISPRSTPWVPQQ